MIETRANGIENNNNDDDDDDNHNKYYNNNNNKGECNLNANPLHKQRLYTATATATQRTKKQQMLHKSRPKVDTLKRLLFLFKSIKLI